MRRTTLAIAAALLLFAPLLTRADRAPKDLKGRRIPDQYIVVLKDGRKAEEGKLDVLLERKGVFFHLWEEQKF